MFYPTCRKIKLGIKLSSHLANARPSSLGPSHSINVVFVVAVARKRRRGGKLPSLFLPFLVSCYYSYLTPPSCASTAQYTTQGSCSPSLILSTPGCGLALPPLQGNTPSWLLQRRAAHENERGSRHDDQVARGGRKRGGGTNSLKSSAHLHLPLQGAAHTPNLLPRQARTKNFYP